MGEFNDYRVIVSRDGSTGQIVAEIPALDIGDYGLDSEQALTRLQEMAAFHLESLAAESKEIPGKPAKDEGR